MAASAGYSGTPLIKKLGIKPGFRTALLNTPKGYDDLLGELPPDVYVVTALDEQCDFIQYFASDYAPLVADFPALKAALKPSGALWISWRKKSANPSGDISEDLIRQLALDSGLVDVKVIAVDATWSGLKLVYRLKDRPAT
ncbi:MAG: DUF3052 domain-containing protein [Anaerolineae bacterium]|nr:DUF3052 domain-containing protein [Anaerolineae bacterium]MCA9907607.1 DUF3052 domain-containing protein [Anaerolineae bacterium]